jgi:hypothetical protein
VARISSRLTKVLIDEPVDHLGDSTLDLKRRVGDDLLFELLLYPRPVEQIHDAADAQCVLEKAMAARFHVGQLFLHRRHAQLEAALHVLTIDGHLTFDVAEQVQVLLDQRESL